MMLNSTSSIRLGHGLLLEGGKCRLSPAERTDIATIKIGMVTSEIDSDPPEGTSAACRDTYDAVVSRSLTTRHGERVRL